MIEIKDLSTEDKTCKIFQIHKDDYEYVDSFLVSLSYEGFEIFTRLFSSIELAEARALELLNAPVISDDLLAGDL